MAIDGPGLSAAALEGWNLSGRGMIALENSVQFYL